jgi:small subunit ribosomal protein S17e
MRRIERGDNVRGISLKLQEEERERRMDYVPDVSALKPIEAVKVDKDTLEMLKALDMSFAADVKVDTGRRERRPRRD